MQLCAGHTRRNVLLFLLFGLLLLLTMYLIYAPPPPRLLQPQNEEESSNHPLLSSPPAQILVSLLSIPRTHPRLKNTLQSLISELSLVPGSMATFTFRVVNLRPGQHPHFESTSQGFASRAAEQQQQPVEFIEVESPRADLSKVYPGKWREVRAADIQLSLDWIAYIEEVKTVCVEWLLMMEDDFIACPGMWAHLVRVLEFLRLTKETGVFPQGPSMVRISFGHSGLLLRCFDLDRYLAFVRDHMYEGAVDSLLGEFWTGSIPEGVAYFKERRQVVYAVNLFQHSGTYSTRDPTTPGKLSYPGCYDPLVSTSLMPGEGFDTLGCGFYDFSPCEWAAPLFLDHPNLREMVRARHGLLNQLLGVIVPLDMLVLGEEGLSCDEVCPQSCAEWLFPTINRCSEIRQMTDCPPSTTVVAGVYDVEGCEVDGVIHLPAIGASVHGSVCAISSLSDAITCATKREGSRRLCPCIKHQ